ncbi:hypothetical protein IJ541_05420 [bacterium]|nr:hypothetical protein [bacterium]
MAVEAINVNQQVLPPKKTGGAGKAWASVFIPGLGQFLDGRNKEGAIYMGTNLGASIGAYALGNSIGKDIFQATQKAMETDGMFDVSKYLSKMPKGKIYGAIALGIGSTILWIANIVDAYKGKKHS